MSPAAASLAETQATTTARAAAQKKPRGASQEAAHASAKPAVAPPDVLRELARVLERDGRSIRPIRKIDTPNGQLASVYDVIDAIKGPACNAKTEFVDWGSDTPTS